MKEIQDVVNSGNYEMAEIILQEYVNSFKYNYSAALLDAAIR